SERAGSVGATLGLAQPRSAGLVSFLPLDRPSDRRDDDATPSVAKVSTASLPGLRTASARKESAMLGTLDRYWWVFLLSGLCAIGFGILSFAWPGLTLLALVILFGVYGIADGLFAFAASRARHEAGQRWGAMVVAGIVSLLAGVAAFAWPGLTAL